jgi:excisionase family DNA binding protein
VTDVPFPQQRGRDLLASVCTHPVGTTAVPTVVRLRVETDGRSVLACEELSMTPLYTISEAAEVLHVPFSWLRDKVTAGQVPHTRLGRHVRFTQAHLGEIVAAGERPVAAAAPTTLTGRRRRRHVS